MTGLPMDDGVLVKPLLGGLATRWLHSKAAANDASSNLCVSRSH